MRRFVFRSASLATFYVDLFSQIFNKIIKKFNNFAQTYLDGSRIYTTFVQYVNGEVRTNFCKTAVDVLN